MNPEDLARAVDAAAEAVDGVTRVYPACVGVRPRDAPRSIVRRASDGGFGRLEVAVCIGVFGDPEEVGGSVAGVVREVPGLEDASVRVRITRVRAV